MRKLSKIALFPIFTFAISFFVPVFIKAMEQNFSKLQPVKQFASDYLIVTHQRSNRKSRIRKPRINVIQNTQPLPSKTEAFKHIKNYLLECRRCFKSAKARYFYLLAKTTLESDKQKIQELDLEVITQITNKMTEILNTIKTLEITLTNYKDISLILQIFAKFKTICSAEYQIIFYKKLKEIKTNLEKQITIFLSTTITQSIRTKLEQALKKLQTLNLKYH